MSTLDWLRGARRRPMPGFLAPIALIAVLAAGCASTASAAKPAAAGSATAPAASSAGSGDMSGMDMGATPDPTGSAASADGVYPVPTQVLGTAVWQGMKITADAMTPVPFLVYNGTTMQTVNPPKNTSFHLMVLLNDAQTNVVIPYASVRGTITEGSKTPFNDSLWPMISRYTGPHYGNDVALPGAGTYKLTLLVSPPVSARHLEYQGVWLKPHTVTFTFHWHQAS
jgi:Fe2+ transport protein